MLSLDTRLDEFSGSTLFGHSHHQLAFPAGCSPLTPTGTKQFDFAASLLHDSMASFDPLLDYGAADEKRGVDSPDGSLFEPLPALSVGDSCSPITSPATSSWTDDALSAASPASPPSLELPKSGLAGCWDAEGLAFAARNDRDEFDADGRAAHGSQFDCAAPEAPLFGSPHGSPDLIDSPANPMRANSASSAQGAADFHFDAQQSNAGVHFEDAFAECMGRNQPEMLAPPSYVPYPMPPTPASAAPPLPDAEAGAGFSFGAGASFAPGSFPNMTLDAHLIGYEQPDRLSGSPSSPEARPQGSQILQLPPSASLFRQSQQQYAQYQYQRQQAHRFQSSQPQADQSILASASVSGVPAGYVPVQFTTVTGATYAVAIPIAATQQTSAIETPQGTYYFVPSQSHTVSPVTAPGPPMPLGVIPTPPTVEASLPTPPERTEPLPPLSLQPPAAPLEEREQVSQSPAPAKSRAASLRSRKNKTQKRDSSSPEAELDFPGLAEPAKSDSFQLPQGPTAAAIAAENAVKAAARLAALGPAHKIRLPVGQGKRGSTKRKSDGGSGSGKKDQSRRFTCPHPGCGRGFARNFNMQSHYKSHLGVREYDCLWCTKKFSRRHDRARHCTTVHEAVVDREGNITGPHPVLPKNKGKTMIKGNDDADDEMMPLAPLDEDHDVDAEGDFDVDGHAAEFSGSPEERDSDGFDSMPSTSLHVG
ncbi:hypothetical protein JCM8202_002388 [Rhodotorula sphaerocarpa]